MLQTLASSSLRPFPYSQSEFYNAIYCLMLIGNYFTTSVIIQRATIYVCFRSHKIENLKPISTYTPWSETIELIIYGKFALPLSRVTIASFLSYTLCLKNLQNKLPKSHYLQTTLHLLLGQDH